MEEPTTPRDPWLRRMAVIVGGGLVLGTIAAVALGVAGATGSSSAFILLLLVTLSFAVASVCGLVSAAIDEFRGRDVAMARPIVGIVLLFATVALSAMTAAVG